MGLFLDTHAGPALGRRFERRTPILRHGDADRHFLERAVIVAHRDAMLAGATGSERPEQLVGLCQRAAAHDRQRAAELAVELGQQIGQPGRDHDLLGCRRDLDQGAVEIEEQRRFPVKFRRCHP